MNNVKLFRLKHGLTQRELAERIGVHVHALSYAERYVVSSAVAKKIAKVLNENVFEILGGDVLKMVPETEKDKEIVINTIKKL